MQLFRRLTRYVRVRFSTSPPETAGRRRNMLSANKKVSMAVLLNVLVVSATADDSISPTTIRWQKPFDLASTLD